ncbi:MAG: hypothetical protein CO138_00300 [Candidatus Moranbacteria bacterium CG_4_9_14_3_um_filter_33_15]|nr:MAG: hypothetical protein CO138_00300 [Candidatus Moranbacteria bacterium CG_4_9_14_3_um_filter_33_15]
MLFKLIQIFLLYLPFQIALNPSVGVDLASARLLAVLFFLFWVAEGLRKKTIFIGANKVTFSLIAFLFFLSFSFFSAENEYWSMRKLFFFFSIFPFYFVVADVVDSFEKKIKLVKMLVISALAISFLGLIQFFSQFIFGINAVYSFWAKNMAPLFLGNVFSEIVLDYPSWLVNVSGENYFRIIATFPDPHMMALFLGLILPLSAGMIITQTRKKVWIFSFLIIFWADLLTFSRGGYLALAGGIFFLIFFSFSFLSQKYRNFLIIGSLILISFLFLPGPISKRFSSTWNFREGSNLGRIEMWKKSIEISSEHIWTGVGLGNYSLAVDPTAQYREPIYSHNTYLDILVETGVFGLFSWLALLGFSLLNFLKKTSQNKLYFFGALSIIIFITHSFVETGLYSPQVMIVLMVLFAISEEKNNVSKVQT